MSNWYYNEKSARYIMKDSARIMFPNFSGVEQTYNSAGRRNFKLIIDDDLAKEMKERGVFVRERPPRNEMEETQYQVKVSVYPDTDVRFSRDGKTTPVDFESLELVDREFRKGHIENGAIGLTFHISRNTRVQNGAYYIRADEIKLPIRRSPLFEEYEDDEAEEAF